jgi:type II secretory pathway component GspD/PulD (secretin)
VVVVPEDRLNAVIVYANRTDRATVENLLKVLDAADVPENLSADRMSMIPVKSMSAMRMLRMLRDLHPAHAEGLSVEMKTNSLLVMASPEMTDQVKQLVEKLDQAAGGPSSRTIQIVPLKKTSSERVEKALEILMRRSHYSQ